MKPSESARASTAGLYVHVPFCLTRCGYCDFNTYEGLDHLSGRYVAALSAEAGLVGGDWREESFVSVFFGGGTPTTLPAIELVKLLYELQDRFAISRVAEVTSEANPDTVDEPYLAAIREGGITRLSLGVQSFDPAVLAALERLHSAESARRAFGAARRAGFDAINVDLIYGAHGEGLESWRRTLVESIGLGPEHVSCYALTIEPATPLGRKVASGTLPAPDPDLQAEMYDLACELLADAGYEHYEVSNWAKAGSRCVHNMGYWQGRPYVGLGAGAHSYRDGRRWWNVRPPSKYLVEVEGGRRPMSGEERLTEEQRNLERLLLGLRTEQGVPVAWLNEREAKGAVVAGLAWQRNSDLVPTEQGMFVASELTVRLSD
ncbi:radical SAM family heme chaperone HemW [soil metagenome]